MQRKIFSSAVVVAALALLGVSTHVLAQGSSTDPDRAVKSAWLKTHAAETLNHMIGQHKQKAQGRQAMLEKYLKSKNLLDDYQKSDYSKKANPNDLDFHQLYRSALQTEAKQGLPSVPQGMSLDQLQRLEKSSVQMAQENFEQLQPLLKENFDMMAYIKSKNQWDDYESFSGDQVAAQKKAYQDWLSKAKQAKDANQAEVDADRRKAILAINDRERAERSANLQKQLQVAQTLRSDDMTRYAVRHYHPSYGWGQGYGDSPWRYGGHNFDGGGGGGSGDAGQAAQAMMSGSNSAMQEANQQLNEATQEAKEARGRERQAESALIDAQSKQEAAEDAAKDQMPTVPPQNVDEDGSGVDAGTDDLSNPASVTQKANIDATRQVPPPAQQASQSQREQPAEQPQQPAEGPVQPQSPAAQ